MDRIEKVVSANRYAFAVDYEREYNFSFVSTSSGHCRITLYDLPRLCLSDKKDSDSVPLFRRYNNDFIKYQRDFSGPAITNYNLRSDCADAWASVNSLADDDSSFSDFLDACENYSQLCASVDAEIEARRESRLALDRLKNARRARKRLVMIAENNYKDFCSFITLTFDAKNTKYDNSYTASDIDSCNDKLNSYLTFIRSRFSGFRYVAVPEKQKNGNIHYHLLTNLPVGSALIPARSPKTVKSDGRIRSIIYYDLPGWSVGFSSSEPISSASKSLRYITKYISKETADFALPSGSHRYYRSQNLDVPVVFDCFIRDPFSVDDFTSIFSSASVYRFDSDEYNLHVWNIYLPDSDLSSISSYLESMGSLVRRRSLT